MIKSTFFILILLLLGKAYGQNNSFDFYNNVVKLPEIAGIELDSLVEQQKVSVHLKEYINGNIQLYELEDWAIVIFLKKFVNAQFAIENDISKVKILSALLTSQNINNAIGIRNKNRLLQLISIERHIAPSGVYFFEENEYKLISANADKEPFKIRDIQFECYSCKTVQLKAKTPKLNSNEFEKKVVRFFNYITQQQDSLSFEYSQAYISYSFDFPMVLSNIGYANSPVSPVFINSLFSALNGKIGYCANRLDSLNFLLKFTQTAVKFTKDIDLYGKKDFASFPENTLAVGKGDCEDKCQLLAFLLSYYFKSIEIVFLSYPKHVRIGIYDPFLEVEKKSFIEYNNKKYFIAEPSDEHRVLGDDFFNIFKESPTEILQ